MTAFRPLFLTLLAQALIAGQRPNNSAASPAQATAAAIKVTTRLVQINVLVHDHHGNPVADLTKADFEVTDNGRPQPIALFSVDALNPPNGASSSPVRASQSVMPSNVVTNRPERQSNVPTSVTVLLLDMYNTKLTDQMYARRQLVKFLRQIRPEDRIAVYLLNGTGFSVVHDFTNNAEPLLAALAKVVPGFSHELDGSDPDPSNTGDDNMDSFLDASNTVMSNFYTHNRVLNTCTAFKTLADHLAGVPGRKNVVWVSGGFPIAFGYGDSGDPTDQSTINRGAAANDRELFADYIEAASQAMNTANVAVYPVDARGLMGLPMADASKSIKVNPQTHQIPRSMMTVDHRNMETMEYMAELTGGRAFYNTNDIQGAIRRAIDDSTVTYTLGYYLPEESWDNKFHRLKVKVNRSGVTIRTKKGYFAQAQSVPNPGRLEQILHEAVWSPLDSTSIGLNARIDPSPALPNASRLVFWVDPAEIQFHQQNENYLAAIDVVLVQQTKRGKLLANVKKTLNITVTAAQFAALKSRGLRAGEDLALNQDTDAVRIVVMDRGSGFAGSVTVPVTPQDKSGPSVAPAQDPFQSTAPKPPRF
jgi:VWFA-related protein